MVSLVDEFASLEDAPAGCVYLEVRFHPAAASSTGFLAFLLGNLSVWLGGRADYMY